jgi:hypothetical protein
VVFECDSDSGWVDGWEGGCQFGRLRDSKLLARERLVGFAEGVDGNRCHLVNRREEAGGRRK